MSFSARPDIHRYGAVNGKLDEFSARSERACMKPIWVDKCVFNIVRKRSSIDMMCAYGMWTCKVRCFSSRLYTHRSHRALQKPLSNVKLVQTYFRLLNSPLCRCCLLCVIGRSSPTDRSSSSSAGSGSCSSGVRWKSFLSSSSGLSFFLGKSQKSTQLPASIHFLQSGNWNPFSKK